MKTLTGFFIGVAIALAVALCLVYFIRGGAHFKLAAIFVGGFAIGMITMYIKMRLLLS